MSRKNFGFINQFFDSKISNFILSLYHSFLVQCLIMFQNKENDIFFGNLIQNQENCLYFQETKQV